MRLVHDPSRLWARREVTSARSRVHLESAKAQAAMSHRMGRRSAICSSALLPRDEEVFMSAAFVQPSELDLPQALTRLRAHAALVRALLDELDRLAPLSARSSDAARLFAVGEQLAEEFGRLGCQIVECAASMTAIPPTPESAEEDDAAYASRRPGIQAAQ
jgi:hypothetical protein